MSRAAVLSPPATGGDLHASSAARWTVLIAVGTGSLMSGLDSSIVNVVLPVVARAFQSDVATVEWVITAYLLVTSGLLMTFGRLGDMRGHRSVYLWGFGVFIAASAVCGLAQSARMLIAARAVQAIGAAILSGNSSAIVTATFPPSERGRALGLQVMLVYIGLAIGPSLGGWLADAFTWRAVFYINVPVGLLALYLSHRFVPHDRPARPGERFDVPGALTFTTGLVLLMLGLNQGHAWGWASAPVLGCLIIAAVLLVAFIRVELRTSWPMLDLSLFGRWNFSAAISTCVISYVGSYTVLFLTPFLLIQARGLSPAQAGLVLTAQPVLMAIIAPLSGTLSDRVGTRLPSTLGLLFQVAGLLLLSRIALDTPLLLVAGALCVYGIGSGLFSSPNTSAAFGSAPPTRRGVASAVLGTSRNLGMVLGIGLSGAIFTTALAAVGPTPGPAAIVSAANLGFLALGLFLLLGVFTSAFRGSPNRPTSL